MASMNRYHSNLQSARPNGNLLAFVEKYLVVNEAKCNRHCKQPANFVPLLEEGSSLVGGYACPDNYVSRVVYFADKPDEKWFESFLIKQVGSSRVRARDIRYATRHGWELGGEAEEEIEQATQFKSLRQYYWTLYPRDEDEKRYGTFLCSKKEGGCGSLFTKPMAESSRLCPKCAKA